MAISGFSSVLVLVCSFTLCTVSLESVAKEISYEDLKALLGKSENLILIDVRTKEEVDQGSIQGSIHIPLDTVEAALAMPPDQFKAKYGVKKPELDAPELVFHCLLGLRGEMATIMAYKLGYKNARNLAGGYEEWIEKEGKCFVLKR